MRLFFFLYLFVFSLVGFRIFLSSVPGDQVQDVGIGWTAPDANRVALLLNVINIGSKRALTDLAVIFIWAYHTELDVLVAHFILGIGVCLTYSLLEKFSLE